VIEILFLPFANWFWLDIFATVCPQIQGEINRA